MPSTYFGSGDLCSCSVFVCNTDSQTYNNIPLFVILDVYGTYFFAPSFSEFDNYIIDVPTGQQTVEVLPEFFWPPGTSSAQDIIWYAAMTNAEMTELFGEMDTWIFGWGD